MDIGPSPSCFPWVHANCQSNILYIYIFLALCMVMASYVFTKIKKQNGILRGLLYVYVMYAQLRCLSSTS